MKILLAGGMGYIGAIMAVELLKKNHEVIIVDNLSNVPEGISKLSTIRRSVSDHQKHNLSFYEVDIANDLDDIEEVYQECNLDLVINLAASKSVEDGELYPMKLMQNNINIHNNLCLLSEKYHVDNFIFASTAAVYSKENQLPYKESDDIHMSDISRYGYSKAIGEEILSKSDLSYIVFRFFNVIGASEYHALGELHGNNIVPKLLNCSKNKTTFSIYGNDYDTDDGTAERDYVDVKDIVATFMIVVDKLNNDKDFLKKVKYKTFNIGTCKPVSVQRIVDTYNKIVDDEDHLHFSYSDRRAGDNVESLCDNSRLKLGLGFVPQITLEESLESAYKYYKQNQKEL